MAFWGTMRRRRPKRSWMGQSNETILHMKGVGTSLVNTALRQIILKHESKQFNVMISLMVEYNVDLRNIYIDLHTLLLLCVSVFLYL